MYKSILTLIYLRSIPVFGLFTVIHAMCLFSFCMGRNTNLWRLRTVVTGYQESGPSVTLAVVRDLPNPNTFWILQGFAAPKCHEFFANMSSRHWNGHKTAYKFGWKLFSSTCEDLKNAKSLFSGSDSLTLGFVWQVQSTSHYQSLATVAQFLWWWLCFLKFCVGAWHVVLSKCGRRCTYIICIYVYI